jgi:hypothetical protein
MAQTLTADDVRQSLNGHVAGKGEEIQAKYGPQIGWTQLQQILLDRACVRYPCQVAFDAGPLLEGEVACASPKGDKPEDGFTICVHPFFSTQPERVPYLVLYQLVLVNYGEFASSADAETFGAAALGIPVEEYYQAVCGLADEVNGSS